MKKKFFIATIVTLAFSSGVFANETCTESTLYGHMEGIQGEMRGMSSDIKSGDNESAAVHLNAIVDFFEQARTETPYKFKTEGLQGNALAEKQAEFTGAIDNSIKTLKDLEVALQSSDTAKIRSLLGTLGNQRKQGHRAFKGDC